MRQNEDVLYAYVLKNTLISKIYISNFKLFKTKLLSNLKINIFEAPQRKTTFIVFQNELPNAINHHMIKMNQQH
jgi:hypothetical protein